MMRVNLTHIILRERSQAPENTYYLINREG